MAPSSCDDDPMGACYFAFGSNMSSARLRERVRQLRLVGRAELPGWRFVCNKTGLDGSAKANIAPAADAAVWGVVYELADDELAALDAIEGGYERIEVDVRRPDGRQVRCQCYTSGRVSDDTTPYDWYRDLLLRGAVEHGLPADYIAMLEALPQRPAQ